jgi:hypothetical protein
MDASRHPILLAIISADQDSLRTEQEVSVAMGRAVRIFLGGVSLSDVTAGESARGYNSIDQQFSKERF